MRILWLGPPSAGLRWLRDQGETVRAWTAPVVVADLDRFAPDLLVSCGYRWRVPAAVLEAMQGRAINGHISLLPWNRGAHPNLWAAYEGTPSGVTWHVMDAGLDTGPILAQWQMSLSDAETLQSSHTLLQEALMRLFRQCWPELWKVWSWEPRPQEGVGTSHRQAEGLALLAQFPAGWDTPLAVVRQAGNQQRSGHAV